MKLTRAARSGLALALVFAPIIGCELIVDGELMSVHCDDEGALGPPACPHGQRCLKGLCAGGVSAEPALGSRCETHEDCADGDVCYDPTAFGDKGQKVCSRTCCSSSDCDPEEEFVCWAPDIGGGNFCRSASLLGRLEVGMAKAGEACKAPAECRSGVCGEGGCIDPCCSDTNCAAAQEICTLIADPGQRRLLCAPPPEKKVLFDPCASDDECVSGLCIEIGGKKRCSMPCCSSAACGLAVVGGTPRMIACDDVPHEGTLVRACASVLPESATAAVGEPCTKNEECRSARCIILGKNGYCSDVCCVDASCGDPSSFVCRPSHLVLGTQPSWSLRCQAK